MTQTNDFRKGFLIAIADNGISPEQLGEYVLEKQSATAQTQLEITLDNLLKPIKGGLGLAKDTAIFGLIDAPLATRAAIGTGLGLGGAYGLYKGHKALTGDKYDSEIDDLKDQQVINEIRYQTRILRHRLKDKLNGETA